MVPGPFHITSSHCHIISFQIEDLSNQAQITAAEKFKAPDASAAGEGIPSTISQPIQEEEENEGEVRGGGLHLLPK
jgi:nascent polypeptide-associated complex subunit alpha